MRKPKVSPRRGDEKTLISVRVPALLAIQIKTVAQTKGGLSKWVGQVLRDKIAEMRNDPTFMEELYEDDEVF